MCGIVGILGREPVAGELVDAPHMGAGFDKGRHHLRPVHLSSVGGFLYGAGYGLVVTPVVGVIPADCQFRIDAAETTAVASVPVASLMQ